MAGTKRTYDESLLRQAFDVARRAREGGDHPFGSLLADHDGNVLLEQGNRYSSEGGDRTAHSERILATRAGKAYDLDFLAGCTMYISGEPCAMCSGSIYWAGIGRIVFGMSEREMKQVIGASQENPTLDLPCEVVFAAGQRPTEVVGPMLADEAAKVHEGYWSGR
jgi:tRNA(Arg) A34 adenosine deaminase TadA